MITVTDGPIIAVAGGDELVRFRAQEFALTDFDTGSTSTTNAITLAITEAEAVLVDYLETLNPTAGFTT